MHSFMRFFLLSVMWHSIAIWGMDTKRQEVLACVQAWYSRPKDQDDGLEEYISFPSHQVSDIPCLQELSKEWGSSKKKSKRKLSDESFLNVLVWTQKEQKNIANPVQDTLLKDESYGQDLLRLMRALWGKRAKKSKTGLFHVPLNYSFYVLHVLYNGSAWYLFNGEQQNTREILLHKSKMEGMVKRVGMPVLALSEKDGKKVFSFVGKPPSPMVSFCDVLATIIDNDLRGMPIKQLLPHFPLSIQQQMRYGAGNKEEDAQKKRLPYGRKLKRNGVPKGKR